MAKRSPRRGGVEAKDAKWRIDVESYFGPRCRSEGCQIPVVHTHHIYGKQAYPRLRNELLNGARLCFGHHKWAHDYPARALRYFLARLSPTDAAKLQQMAREKR
jgi:hypothetical protein